MYKSATQPPLGPSPTGNYAGSSAVSSSCKVLTITRCHLITGARWQDWRIRALQKRCVRFRGGSIHLLKYEWNEEFKTGPPLRDSLVFFIQNGNVKNMGKEIGRWVNLRWSELSRIGDVEEMTRRNLRRFASARQGTNSNSFQISCSISDRIGVDKFHNDLQVFHMDFLNFRYEFQDFFSQV